MSATEDKKEEEKELIDKDTLIYLGAGAGVLGLVGVLAMAGMGWMKEQDQEKRKLALQKQQLEAAQRALQQRQRPPESGWPNPIPRNTIPQNPAVMELPSENRDDDEFIGQRPSAYAGNEQKFLVTDDPVQQINPPYPTINPNASPQQIGNKISRVMSLDNNNNPAPPPLIRNAPQNGDDEDFSDLF